MKQELDLEAMEKVTGGVVHTVNTGIAGLVAAILAQPQKSSRQIGSISNGAQVDTVSDALVYDPESGRNFVQVRFNGKTGWIASSILGLKR